MYDGYVENEKATEIRKMRIEAEIEQRKIRDEMIAEVAPMLGGLKYAIESVYEMDNESEQIVRWLGEPSIAVDACGAQVNPQCVEDGDTYVGELGDHTSLYLTPELWEKTTARSNALKARIEAREKRVVERNRKFNEERTHQIR